MITSRLTSIVLASVGYLAVSSATHAQLAQSNFDLDADGWVVADRSEFTLEFVGTRPVTYLSTGGHPGGFIQAADSTTNWWHWRAPAKFLGDKQVAYGGALSFDLFSDLNSARDGLFVQVFVEGNGVSLFSRFDFLREPNTWRHFSVTLRESAGWTNFMTQLPATAQEMKSVLSNLTAIDINGEYASGFDTGGLDNVALTAGCPPVSIRISEAEVCWPSQSNTLYRVNYRSAFETTNTWVPLVTNVIGNGGVMCIYDKIPPGRPQRSYQVVCPSE